MPFSEIPNIDLIPAKNLIGIYATMSLGTNVTQALFSEFMPRRHEIKGMVNESVIDLKIYDRTYFKQFDPSRKFQKWACVEVDHTSTIPFGMDQFYLPGGLYARFEHGGGDNAIFRYIFEQWIPNSDFGLDTRPHFDEILIATDKRRTLEFIHIPITAKL